ncbi:MAG: hypothetical protein K0R67_2555 [Paenibacillus sp.]|nr:hypothetical protein [Paenibacillus sp.]
MIEAYKCAIRLKGGTNNIEADRKRINLLFHMQIYLCKVPDFSLFADIHRFLSGAE